MNDLLSFSNRVHGILQSGDRQPHWAPAESDRYMAEMSGRRDRFNDAAERIMRLIVRPRLSILAGFFANAGRIPRETDLRATLMLGYSERFPTSARMAFGVEHDVRFERLLMCYEASMVPLFIKFNERDKLVLSLDEVDEPRITAWVEERLLEFLDAYLQIDRGGGHFDDEAATDPVCGMRITRSTAAAIESYFGHPYFFCSTDCAERFRSAPKAFVSVKTM